MFRPEPNSLTALTPAADVQQLTGSDFTEWRMDFQDSDWASLVIRQYNDNMDELEVEWLVGPMPGYFFMLKQH